MLKRHGYLIRNLIIIVSGIGLGAFANYYQKNNKPNSWSRLPQGKQNRPIEIKLSASNGLNNREATTISANITVYNIVGNKLSFSWVLPEDVEVLQGEVVGDFFDVQNYQTISKELVVKNFGGDPISKTIALQVFEERNGVKFGGSSAISNQMENQPEENKLFKQSLPTDIKIHQ